MDKLGRNYILKVQQLDGVIREIKPPFTMEFDVRRSILSSANVSSIRVYNLAPRVRNQIVKDLNDYGLRLDVFLYAGYGLNMPIIFQGNIKQAWSHRQKVDFITEIESYDGGYAFINGMVTQPPFPAGTPNVNVMRSLMADLPGVTEGTIGSVAGSLQRGAAYNGKTADVLAQLSNGAFFIDNCKANILGPTECLQGSIDTIDANTGLLGTPIREQNIIHIETMFEPRLLLGQKIRLVSETAPNRNSEYKVIDIHHRGTISDAVCGDAITSIGLAYGNGALAVI